MDIAGASIHGPDRRLLFPEYPGLVLTEADVMAPENLVKTLAEIAAEKYARMQEED